ncbi:MAG TPA: DUF2889 domain-containing protein [Acidimicrobiia bacterium]
MSFPEPPSDPVPTPPRRPGSVRRTSTLLMHWPDGYGTQMRVEGRARDLRTTGDGDAAVVAEDALVAGVAVDRTIEDIESEPHRAELPRMVGASGGGRLRRVVDETVPGERDAGSPLYLLLDDLAGATLIAPFAWSQSSDDWQARAGARLREHARSNPGARVVGRDMEGICSGFRPGSSALAPDGSVNIGMRHNVASVPPLVAPDDPLGWHTLASPPAVAMRRARRIDVWASGDALVVDAMFRDSCWRPDGTEVAVHEYRLDVVVDPATGRVTEVRADPRVLPYPECPPAAGNVARLVGVDVRDLRAVVLERLRGVDCCTHLNDALRSLAEVPVLAASLAAQVAE